MITSFLLASIEFNDQFIIDQTKGTSYDKIAWNLNLINNNPEKISESIIFLGPSLVQGGICDSTLNSNGYKSINMGVNHNGAEISSYFVNRLIKYHPKKIYIHLSKYNIPEMHPMTPLMYTPSSLLSNGQEVNFHFITYIFKRLPFVFKYFSWNFFHSEKRSDQNQYGVVYQKGEYTESDYELTKTEIIKSQ